MCIRDRRPLPNVGVQRQDFSCNGPRWNEHRAKWPARSKSTRPTGQVRNKFNMQSTDQQACTNESRLCDGKHACQPTGNQQVDQRIQEFNKTRMHSKACRST
eukprot:7591641-Alexandrium_andersonii.AAC.1